MKTVGIIIPQLHRGGAARAASRLSEMLKRWCDVRILSFENGGAGHKGGGDLFTIDEPNRYGSYSAGVLWRRVRKVREWKRREKIDVAISFMEGASLVNILSRLGEKVIVSVRSGHDQNCGMMERLRRRLIYRSYSFADKVVVVSKLLKEAMGKSYGVSDERVEVIYNHYRREEIHGLAMEALEPTLDDKFSGPIVITAGRLVAAKGQWHLIRAIRKVVDSGAKVTLVILGSGELRNHLESLVRDLDLTRHVCLLGHQDNPFKYIAKATMFVLPSLYEGFPNALCEAMACGVPVISTDCRSGPREILSPTSDCRIRATDVELAEYGILTPALDREPFSAKEPLSYGEQALARSIDTLLHEDDLRKNYEQRSQERILDFSEELASERWRAILC